MSQKNVSTVEARAAAAERSISAKPSTKSALEAAITSAELYMQALKICDNAVDKKRLNGKLSELLAKAESLKSKQDTSNTDVKKVTNIDITYPAATRALSTREEIILLEGSKLNGVVFKPWKEAPAASEFELKPGESLYEEPPLSLSEDQLRSFAGWKRGAAAISKIKMYQDGVLLPNNLIMNLPGKPDLVQDMASDCSVVASMCAGAARAEKGHTRILGSIVHPYNVSDQSVKTSANGKYVLRLYFNGCWRRVDIDDSLPTSSTDRVLHVVDRSHPGLLWPALVEKAYLKVRGGYDFPGSNSGTDLAVFTGWIPQQIFLHDEDVDQNSLWAEIESAFVNGDILLTIGTGKLSRREQQQLGLAAEHDYAILDLKTRDGIKEMLIKNPWSDGEVWKGAARRKPNPNHEDDESNISTASRESLDMLPGTFWMDYNSVFHHFENLYINWNPGLFSHRQDLHLSWHVPGQSSIPNVFVDQPQYSVTINKDGELWLLLNRHFRTGDYTHANSGKNGFISLYLYDHQGCRVLSAEGIKSRAPFVDSPNTLLRFDAKAKTAYTVVVVSQNLPAGKHNFTLTALARSEVDLRDSPSRYSSQTSQKAAWIRDTSGGNTESPRYLRNPQFAISIDSPDTSVALVLRLSSPLPSSSQLSPPPPPTEQTDIHVKVLLVYSPTQRGTIIPSEARAHRVQKLHNRDIVASSGDYRRECAVIETKLNPGIYTIICSTFDEGQLAKFSLDLYTSSPQKASMTPIPGESSGRLSIISTPAIFPSGATQLIAQLTIPRVSRAIFIGRAKLIRGARSCSSSSSLYRLSLQQGRPPYVNIVASSSPSFSSGSQSTTSSIISTPSSLMDDTSFSSIYTDLRIDDTDLSPDLHRPGSGGLWLVIERPIQSASENGSMGFYIEVEILAEERFVLGGWQALQS